MLGADPLSLDPVSSSYRETAAFASRSEGGPITASATSFYVRTILFQTLYLFFVVRHVNREFLHVAVTPCPTAEGTAQQLTDADLRGALLDGANPSGAALNKSQLWRARWMHPPRRSSQPPSTPHKGAPASG
jgi:Pentapeptide repeats (8 copies)